jgi:hypothetical protein
VLNNLFKGLGIGGKTAGPSAAGAPALVPEAAPRPYREEYANVLYNLLFCDFPGMFAPRPDADPAPWQTLLFGDSPDAAAVRALAADEQQEARTRALAYNWLRMHGQPVPPRILLGTIVEVPQNGGLDTLAAFKDGAVRYINQTGKSSIFEGVGGEIGMRVSALLAASQAPVDRIGPWDKPRLPPPGRGRIRLTFLVSDGLYFGEGDFDDFSRDAMAGPVVAAATQLLVQVVNMATGPV